MTEVSILIFCLAGVLFFGLFITVVVLPLTVRTSRQQESVLGLALNNAGKCLYGYRLCADGSAFYSSPSLGSSTSEYWQARTSYDDADDFLTVVNKMQKYEGVVSTDILAAVLLFALGEPSLCAVALGLVSTSECDYYGPLRYPGFEVKRQQPDKRRRFSSNITKASASML